MKVSEFQEVLFCTQCEEKLPRRCTKCVKHPDRKPRVVELFGVPPVINTNSCGCVLLLCQRDGCGKTMWRHPRADGTLGKKNHFHDQECVRIVTSAARIAKRITADCSCGCGRSVTRPASNMRAKYAYFSQKCHFRHRTVLAAKNKKELEHKNPSRDTGLLYCVKCRDVEEHTIQYRKPAVCLKCQSTRSVPESSGAPDGMKMLHHSSRSPSLESRTS